MKIIVGTIVLVATLVAPAFAETILTFDDLGLAKWTVITDQYIDQGVLFSPLNGELQLREASYPIFSSEPMGLAEIPYSGASVIIADFLVPATSAGAWIDFGYVGAGVILKAFDGPKATGNLLGTASTVNESYLGLTLEGIKSVRFEERVPAYNTTYLIDNFTFTPVPEPATVGLMGIVSCGFLFVRRRFMI